MLTDTHAHLDFPEFRNALPGVLKRAREAGVHRILTVGTTLEGSRAAVALAEAHEGVFAIVGIHPNHAALVDGDPIPELRRLAASPRVVALGEMGLDHHRLPGERVRHPERGDLADAELVRDSLAVTPEAVNEAAKTAQARLFKAQLDLAAELAMPVVIHERDAWQETLEILRPYIGRVRAVFHCFGKGPALAREVFSLGHLVSFTGIVTFRNAPDAHATARECPADRYMLETDCPFLAPVPHRGKVCEPSYVALTAAHIATLRGVAKEQVAAETEATVERFFRFRAGSAR